VKNNLGAGAFLSMDYFGARELLLTFNNLLYKFVRFGANKLYRCSGAQIYYIFGVNRKIICD
jgi:hypothetical protein